jgi:hypothetical protein
MLIIRFKGYYLYHKIWDTLDSSSQKTHCCYVNQKRLETVKGNLNEGCFYRVQFKERRGKV